MSDTNAITESWTELKTLVESIELDIAKNAGGNASAGVRARKGLRLIKSKAADIVKLTVELDKSRKKEKQKANT